MLNSQPGIATPALVIDVAELGAHTGDVLGHSSWHLVTQDEVATFASLSGDDQWIHVDPVQAANGPFGATIAHGYFTLSLATRALDEVVTVTGAGVVLNYGSNRVRYPAPLPVGARVRTRIELAAVDEIRGGVQATFGLTYEVEGSPKPCCVAEIVYRYYPELPAKGPSGPSEREAQGPSGPSEREAQGPSGPSEREAQGPSGPSEREAQGPSGPSEREAQGPSGPSEREAQVAKSDGTL